MIFHYAIQTCDTYSNQNTDRFTGTTKKEITWKCVTSFFIALKYAAEQNKEANHIVRIFDDRSSEETFEYLLKLASSFECSNIRISVTKTKIPGIMESIRECYEWLREGGKDFVYQVQDDYLFSETSIYEVIDIWYQIYYETKNHAIVSPFNDKWLWLLPYRNKSTPRAVFVGKQRYWIQYYDASCSFFTSVEIFRKNWNYLEKFLNLPPTGIYENGKHEFESISINKIFVDEGVLGIVPISTLAMHLQSELEKDPYIDWKEWWDGVKLLS